MTNFIKGIKSQAYLGVNASSPPNMIVLARAPTTADTKNVDIGDFWLNSETESLYQLTSLAEDVATWITVAVPAGVGADIFNTDAGTANTNLQTITMHGGSNLNTSGAGSTVTFNLNNTVAVSGSITAGTGLVATTGGVTATTSNITALDGNGVFANTTNTNLGPLLILTKNRAGAAAQPGDSVAVLSAQGFDGTSFQVAAQINASIPASGTVAAGQVPGQWVFSTTPNAVSAPIQRLSIEANGQVVVNNADSGAVSLTVFGPRAMDGIVTGFTGTAWIEQQFGVQTTNASTINIFQEPVASGEMILVEAKVSGFRADFTQSIVASVFFGAYRPSGGNVTIIGAPTPTVFATSTENVTNTVDTGTQTARVNVIGVAAQTYNWVCKVSYMFLVSNT